MKKLVLAEKPSVGKEIARVLGCNQHKNGYMEGKDYIVTWALGHLVTLAGPDIYDKKYATWALDDLPIMPPYLKKITIQKTSKQFGTVKHQMNRQDVNEIIIATDAGREGELVARWIIDKVQTKKPLKRLWISSVTDRAIKEGFRNLKPGKAYEPLYKAAVARSEGDWLVGINATRALTTKYNSQLSCGRVQTPTLAIIAKREDVIRKFVPKKYYGLEALSNKQLFKWHMKNGETRSFNQEMVQEVQSKLKGSEGKINDLKKKNKKVYAANLYDLTELQRDAHNRYGYSPKQTLSLMQKLYEQHKALTYPRTDSRFLTDDLLPTLSERLRNLSLQPYKTIGFKLQKSPIRGNKHFIDNNKVTDHHAIIPTEENIIISDLTYDERNIYELVVKRFLEVLMPPFEYEETTVTLKVGSETFDTKGKRVIALGWKSVSVDSEKDLTLPLYRLGETVKINDVRMTKGETKPPSYFNEATLLSAMEKPGQYMDGDDELKRILSSTGGLGTVATRADIIEKLYHQQVMELKGSSIHITNKGRQLLEVAPEALKSPKLTGEWEQKLDLIAKGKLDYKKFVDEMRRYTEKIITDIKKSETKFKHDNITSTKCPECGKLMMSISTKTGNSLVCQDRECGHRISISRVTNARCPECHKKLILSGSGDKKIFVCKCGYREKLSSFEKRKKEGGKGGGKRDFQNYQKQQEAEAKKQKASKNPFAALSNLNIDK